MNWSLKSVTKTLLISGLLLLTNLPIFSQNLKRIEKKAVENFDNGNFVAARDQFITLLEPNPDNNVVTSYLASCYLELDKPQLAHDALAHLTNPDKVNDYLLILTNYYLEDFEKAEQLIAEFGNPEEFDVVSLEDKIRRAKINYGSNSGILVQNFGDEVNSAEMEYSAVMYNGYYELLFTSRKEEGEETDVDGLAFENIYYTHLDSVDNWQAPEPFKIQERKSRTHDATVQFFESGQKMILYQDGRLYSATLNDGVWSKQEDLVLHEEGKGDTHCYISPDEQSIIFASDYASNGDHLDLFVSYKNSEGLWSEPTPITELNTDMDEDSPFLASDSTLYFSSNGHNSMGGYDVYKSTYDVATNSWGAPENLGYPINTVADDIYYTTEGKLAYLSSNRLGGEGSLDLYRVFLFNRVKVQGRLLSDNQEPISDAEIDITYEDTHLKSKTDENGNYELFVPINTKMHITFIKDSLNLIQGEYIANISFKDENNNEFDFFIDYVDDHPEIVNGSEDDQVVKNLNIQVKNDYKENPVLASVPAQMEDLWADSVNFVAENREVFIENPEKTYVSRLNENDTDIRSGSMNIREVTIKESEKTLVSEKEAYDPMDVYRNKKGYTIQILAMPAKRSPDTRYFDKLESTPISNVQGKDGLNRYYVGSYQSKEDALKAMWLLRKAGYGDAFIRKLQKYADL